jgi:hypothetical protein
MKRLALQRETLAAIDDPEKLAAIAEREGVDPALWAYSQELFRRYRAALSEGGERCESVRGDRGDPATLSESAPARPDWPPTGPEGLS